MGGKPTRTRKCVHLCLAGFIIFSLSGCLLFREKETVKFKKEELLQTKQSREPQAESLQAARSLLERNDFEGALIEYQKVLTLSGMNPPADEALFQMGMIYSHYGNPKKDYAKSLPLLRKLVKDYPNSLRADQAKLWIALLQENDRLNQAVQKLQQTIEEIKKVDLEIEEKRREKTK